MKHLPMGWLLPAAVLFGFTMSGTAAHTTEKEANTVDPERLAEYLVFATECGRRSMAEEPGVLMMYSMQDKAHPEQITILEIYADSAAYERHIKTPHFQKYKQGTLAMVRKLELLDQTPLVPEMKMK